VLFTDSRFLLFFLPILLASYFLSVWVTPRDPVTGQRNASHSNWVLALGSVAFYAVGTTTLALVVFTAVVFNYVAALGIARAQRAEAGAIPEALLTLAVTGNVVLLGVVKYAFPSVLGSRVTDPTASLAFAAPQLLVPIGFVFVMCHSVSYLVDVYQRRGRSYTNPVAASLFLVFVPTVVAGPILRHRDVGAQFTDRQVGIAAFSYGVRRFAVGLGKTFLIANTLAGPADHIFALPVGQLGVAEAWMGAVCFSLQMYFDFSGYSDMAIGLGRMLGFRLPENFKWPYAAQTVHDFWHRWNISLTAWLRTYVGLSLESRASGVAAGLGRVMALFVLIGVWHGPGWNVIRWGLFHGTFVIIERFGGRTLLMRFPAWMRHLYLLAVVVVGWVFFRAETLSGGVQFVRALAGLQGGATQLALLPLTSFQWAALVAGAVGAVPLLPWLSRWVVTVDALATSALMLASATVVFTWRTGATVFARLARLFRRR
jgi:alginate O-acetyltransferase complex protein AlgI